MANETLLFKFALDLNQADAQLKLALLKVYSSCRCSEIL